MSDSRISCSERSPHPGESRFQCARFAAPLGAIIGGSPYFANRRSSTWSTDLVASSTVARVRGVSISRRQTAVATAVLVVVAACGGGDDSLPVGSVDTLPAVSVDQTDVPVVESTSAGEPDNIIEPPVVLASSSWTATDYELQNSVGLTNVFGGTDVTFEFGADGQLTGFNTCNEYEATWVVEGPYYEKVPTLDNDAVVGQAIFITELTHTEEGCPEGFESEQQADIFASLLGADRWRSSDDGQLFLSGDGIFIGAEQVGG